MRIYKYFMDFSKEEHWLGKMAADGLKLVEKSNWGGYVFVEGGQPEDMYRIDYHRFKSKADFEDYRALFEDSGWRLVSGTWQSGFQYFIRINDAAGSDIFSDAPSRAGRYKRLAAMWLSMSVVFTPLLAALMWNDFIDPSVFLHPDRLYYTPGLWDMEGGKFLRSFLFETPFAAFRGILWLILPLSLLFYWYCSYRSYRLYTRHKLN